MTYRFDNEAYRKTLELVKEIKDHNEQHRQFDQDIPDSVGLNIKSILIAGMIMGLALFVLVGNSLPTYCKQMIYLTKQTI